MNLGSIIERELLINNAFSPFQAKLITPEWSDGFECKPESCGLCCISEIPTNVPTKQFKPFNIRICKYFDFEQKKCGSYTNRPMGCKTFPFIFGFKDGTLILSPSLECPSTTKDILDLESIQNGYFKDSQIGQSFSGLEFMYRKVQSSPYWKDANIFWEKLSEVILQLFERRQNFPFLNEAKALIFNYLNDYYNITLRYPKHPTMDFILTSMLKNRGGIATNFRSNKLYHVRIKKRKAKILLLDVNTKKVNEINIKLPLKALELEIETDALEMLKDYIVLLMKRPFLGLSAFMCLNLIPSNIPSLAASNLVGAFVNLEAGATFTALKNKPKIIDKNSMREIISFSDGCLCGTFKNPAKTIH